jgi:hypothetical protein
MPQPAVGVFTHRHVTVTFKDGAGTPLTRTLGPGPGNVKFDNIAEGNKDVTLIRDRGANLEYVYGDDKEMSGSIDVYEVGDETGSSILDAILKTGDFASATTTDAGGVVWTGTMVVVGTRNGVTNTYTLSKVRIEASYAEAADGNLFSLSYRSAGGLAAT